MQYEAKRAGLDPQLVLGVIQVESNFRKYAVSRAGARGYMQVMPFWIELIGTHASRICSTCAPTCATAASILRHYLDIERGDMYRALGRYNGSLGQARLSERRAARVAHQLEIPGAHAVYRVRRRDHTAVSRAGAPAAAAGSVCVNSCSSDICRWLPMRVDIS